MQQAPQGFKRLLKPQALVTPLYILVSICSALHTPFKPLAVCEDDYKRTLIVTRMKRFPSRLLVAPFTLEAGIRR